MDLLTLFTTLIISKVFVLNKNWFDTKPNITLKSRHFVTIFVPNIFEYLGVSHIIQYQLKKYEKIKKLINQKIFDKN